MYPPNPLPGIPTSLALTPSTTTLAPGQTLQLTTVLTDTYGTACSPSAAFTYSSSNPDLITISSSGLCTAVSVDPTVLGTGGQVAIRCTYPWAGSQASGQAISAEAIVIVTVQSSVTEYVQVPLSVGWKQIPSALVS